MEGMAWWNLSKSKKIAAQLAENFFLKRMRH